MEIKEITSEKIQYITNDGQIFNDETQALNHSGIQKKIIREIKYVTVDNRVFFNPLEAERHDEYLNTLLNRQVDESDVLTRIAIILSGEKKYDRDESEQIKYIQKTQELIPRIQLHYKHLEISKYSFLFVVYRYDKYNSCYCYEIQLNDVFLIKNEAELMESISAYMSRDVNGRGEFDFFDLKANDFWKIRKINILQMEII
jgi:hypothetical protein